MDYFIYLQNKPMKQERLGVSEDKQLVQVTKVDSGGVRIPVLNTWLAGRLTHPLKGSWLAMLIFFFTFSHCCKSPLTQLSDSMSTDSPLNLPKLLNSSCTLIITHKSDYSHTLHNLMHRKILLFPFKTLSKVLSSSFTIYHLLNFSAYSSP